MALNNKIDELLSGAVARADVPGVVAAVTTAEGTIYQAGFGERELGGGVAMSPDTVGWIASMTKAITSVAALQLVEEGRLVLDQPAGELVAHLGQVEVLTGFDDTGRPLTRPPRRPVTLRHLLSHTSGLGYDFWNPEVIRYQEATGLPPVASRRNDALLLPLLFDPGERWNYSIGIDWVGKMVEAVAGRTLGQVMQERIFEPLGMTSTAFQPTPDMERRQAKAHARNANDSLEPMERAVVAEPEFEMGGGGLYSSVEDYLKFIRMILNRGSADGRQVLQPETVAEMSRNQIGGCRVGAMTTAMPGYSNDVEFLPGVEKTWGLAFMINEEAAPSGRSAGSLFWGGIANSYYWIDPARGIGGAYLTQILPFADAKSLALFQDFESTVYDNL